MCKSIIYLELFVIYILANLKSNVFSYYQHAHSPIILTSNFREISLRMMDEFVTLKLESIKRTFDALTERLADPDLANDRKEMLLISRERSSIEPTVLAFDSWKELDDEKKSINPIIIIIIIIIIISHVSSS